jgi:hypothetical protein
LPIVSPEEAGNKAAQLLGWPKYFRATVIKRQEGIGDLPPQWIVSADIGKIKKAANVCIMFPQDMEPTPEKPPAGTFEAKLWGLRLELREFIELLDQGLPQPPSAGNWWLRLDKGVDRLRQVLKEIWENKF